MDRVTLTQKLRKQFTDSQVEKQMNGEPHPDWPTWVKEQGYDVDPSGLVQTPQTKVTEAIVKKQ